MPGVERSATPGTLVGFLPAKCLKSIGRHAADAERDEIGANSASGVLRTARRVVTLAKKWVGIAVA